MHDDAVPSALGMSPRVCRVVLESLYHSNFTVSRVIKNGAYSARCAIFLYAFGFDFP